MNRGNKNGHDQMLRDETVVIRICAHQNTVSLYLTYETVEKWGMLDYDKKKFFMEVEIHLSNAAYNVKFSATSTKKFTGENVINLAKVQMRASSNFCSVAFAGH